MLYSPGCWEVVSVLVDVEVGVLADCDLLSADITQQYNINDVHKQMSNIPTKKDIIIDVHDTQLAYMKL